MRAAVGLLLLLILLPSVAWADGLALVRLTPTPRAQIAIWVEDTAGNFLGTLRLTDAVALRGIGNRAGALQMNSGYRWPYGRREGALPVWAHRRAQAPDASLFPMVIFQNREEGRASGGTSSRDDYFCLSFVAGNSQQEALDAVSCASIFRSDKGRYVTPTDVANGYGEPFAPAPCEEILRPLPLGSLYPPRRDLRTFEAATDHADARRFRTDAMAVMPELDAVTMATLRGDMAHTLQIPLPPSLIQGDYVLFVEVNLEGDHNETYSKELYPTPSRYFNGTDFVQCPAGYSLLWDSWAADGRFGYPYRGQPSVVYSIPFTVGDPTEIFSVTSPVGYGTMHGESGALSPMDGSITDDPEAAPGSGADRLRSIMGAPRITLRVVPESVCDVPDPPAECGTACVTDAECTQGFLCGTSGHCVGRCDEDLPPPPVASFSAATHPDIKASHHFARLTFTPTEDRRSIVSYQVKVSEQPITTELEFLAARNANAAELDTVGLTVCETTNDGEVHCPPAGAPVTVDIGQLVFETDYHVAIRAVDECGDFSPFVTSQVSTTPIHFTTVSPCFVATATYGSAMADEVVTLRSFRDRYLMTNGPGRAFVAAYYAVGPSMADIIRERPALREASRVILAPFVALAHLLVD